MKKLLMATAFLVAFVVATDGMAATAKKCNATVKAQGSGYDPCLECAPGYFQDKNTGKCVKCPAGSYSDNGNDTTCSVCPAKTYSAAGAAKCTKCPENATCDGKTVTCKTGYTQVINNTTGAVVCKLATCTKNQYLVLGKCTKCPENATCDGIRFTCKAGFELKNDQCVIKGCPSGSYTTSKGCVSECSTKTGFPYYLAEGRKCVTEKECTQKGYKVNKTNGQCVKKK